MKACSTSMFKYDFHASSGQVQGPLRFAVGQTVRVRSDGSISGFSWGMWRKHALPAEGAARVAGNRAVEFAA